MTQGPIKDLIEEFGKEVVEVAQRNLGAFRTVKGKKRRSVASGALKDSLSFINKTRNRNPIVQFTTNSAETKKYADIVEYGRRKGARQPPVEPILKWIDQKGIRPRNKQGGFIKVTEANKKAMAFAIARSIGKNGTPETRYYRDAIETVLERRGPDFLLALEREIEIRLNLNNRK